MLTNESILEGNAYHEAGHAVVGVHFGLEFESIKMNAGEDGKSAFITWKTPSPLDPLANVSEPKFLHDWCFMIIAGRESQLRYRPDTVEYTDDMQDRARLTLCFRKCAPDVEENSHEKWRPEVRDLIKTPKIADAIHGFAKYLLSMRDPICYREGNDVIRALLAVSVVPESK